MPAAGGDRAVRAAYLGPRPGADESALAIGRQLAQFIVRKQAEARYREVVERSPSAIMVHSEGRIVFANRAAAKLLGTLDPGQLLGRSVYDFLHADHRALARERVGRILEASLALGSMEMKAVRLDGSVVDIDVSSCYFVHEGRPAVLAIARDISERKAAEQKILRLSNLYAALSQTNRAITRLTDPQALFEEVCRIAAQLGQFSLAAVAMIEPVTGWVRAVAAAGTQMDGKAGRAETATDPAPLEMFETVINLKPEDQWRKGVTVDMLKDEIAGGGVQASYTDGKRLYTHAGLRSAVREILVNEMRSSKPKLEESEIDLFLLSDHINKIVIDSIKKADFGQPIFHVDSVRGGDDPVGGIFWCDFRSISPSIEAWKIPQIFGHTQTSKNGVNTAKGLKLIDVDAGMYHFSGGKRVWLEITPETHLLQHTKARSKWTTKLISQG